MGKRELELESVEVHGLLPEANHEGLYYREIALTLVFTGVDGEREAIDSSGLDGCQKNGGPFCFSRRSIEALKTGVYEAGIHPRSAGFFWVRAAGAITDLIPSPAAFAAA